MAFILLGAASICCADELILLMKPGASTLFAHRRAEFYHEALMLTAAQIRMARGCLRWSVKELAEASSVSSATIRRMEEGEGVPKSLADNLGKLQRTLEAAGIEFIPQNGGGPGVRLREPQS